VAPVTLEIDGWLRFSASAPHAQMILGLRRRIAEVLRSQLLDGGRKDDGAVGAVVSAVASLMQSCDCGAGADSAQPLPKGWMAVEDPSSSTGRVFYKNKLSGATQRERPTRPATAAPSKQGPVRLAPVAPVAVELTAEEKARKEEQAQAAAKHAAEEKVKQAKAAEEQAKQAKAAALRLAKEGEQAGAKSRSQKGVRVQTVSKLLKSLEIEHYAEGFEAAGIDDAALAEIIDIVNEDAAEGAEEVEKMISEAGVRGGAAVKLRRALAPPQKARGGDGGGDGGGGGRGGGRARGGRGSGGGRGRGGGRGGGKQASKKEKAAAAAAEKKQAAAADKKKAAQKAALLQASKLTKKKKK